MCRTRVRLAVVFREIIIKKSLLYSPSRFRYDLRHQADAQSYHSSNVTRPHFNSIKSARLTHNSSDSNEQEESESHPDEHSVLKIQNVLKNQNRSVDEIQKSLNELGLSLVDDLILKVLQHNQSDWKSAHLFFNWISESRNWGYYPGSRVCNEMIDILGKAQRFKEAHQVLDEMSERKLISERTFSILLNRYAAAHRIEDTIDVFHKRKHYGLELDLIAFQTLLMSLCRHKHVEAAEFLFRWKKKEFSPTIMTMNIILNGWCVMGRLKEAKRFWNDIVSFKCKPDLYTYGSFIHSLTKSGKITTALRLFRSMAAKGCTPDVVISNCIIDGLCFKKRIPEALEIFSDMKDGSLINVVTYNTLIKHMCRIGRMGKAYELLDEMEAKKGGCYPNARTYSYLMKEAKNTSELGEVLERMKRNGCGMMADTCNLILKLFSGWNDEGGVKWAWEKMERDGLGPDQRSYTIMLHWLFDLGKTEEALRYYSEMKERELIPEPRTEVFVNAISAKLKLGSGARGARLRASAR